MSYAKSLYFEETQKVYQKPAQSLQVAKAFLIDAYQQLIGDLESVYHGRDNETGKRRIAKQITLTKQKLNQFLQANSVKKQG